MLPANRVLVVVGTRPEAVKLAPVIRELRRDARLETRVAATGQHRDLVAPILELFGLRADVDLDLMETGQSPARATGRTLTALDSLLDSERPALVVGQGDTSTVLATALASFYRRIPFAHVEAGLRTGDLDAPFPEEMHRRVATQLAALHFAPTDRAARHLRDAGVDPERIEITGNPVVDAVQLAAERLGPPRSLPRPRILVTAHRRENFGPPLESICAAVRAIAADHDVEIVVPVHPNPAVRDTVRARLGAVAGVELCEPLDYVDCVRAMQEATLILTDSGGVQEEAPALGKPVLVLRERTERGEGIDAGCARLVGTDAAEIVAATARLLQDPAAYRAMAGVRLPYGDGRAAPRIAAAIGRFLSDLPA